MVIIIQTTSINELTYFDELRASLAMFFLSCGTSIDMIFMQLRRMSMADPGLAPLAGSPPR
jgi:hypothetical protein